MSNLVDAVACYENWIRLAICYKIARNENICFDATSDYSNIFTAVFRIPELLDLPATYPEVKSNRQYIGLITLSIQTRYKNQLFIEQLRQKSKTTLMFFILKIFEQPLI